MSKSQEMQPEHSASEPEEGCAKCSNVAPIAKVTVWAHLPPSVELYAPGLPLGEHDLYPSASSPSPASEPPAERPSPMIDGIDSAMALQMADSADRAGVDTQHGKALIVLARAHRELRERFAKACGEVTRLSQPPAAGAA